MPITTSDQFTAGQPVPEPTPEPVAAVEVASSGVCGHVNRHVAPPLECALAAGHAGNHRNGLDEWKDAAGSPVE